VRLSLAAMLAEANDLLAIHRWGKRLTPKGLAAWTGSEQLPPLETSSRKA
jgi:hypothetical protein